MSKRIEALKNIFSGSGGSDGFLCFADHGRRRFTWEDYVVSMTTHGLNNFVGEKPTLQSAFRTAIQDHDKAFGHGKVRKYWSPIENDRFGKILTFRLVNEVAGEVIEYNDDVELTFLDTKHLTDVMSSKEDHPSSQFTIDKYREYEGTGLSNKVYTSFAKWADYNGALSLPNGTKWLPASASEGITNFQEALSGFSRISVWPLKADMQIKREVVSYALEDIGKRVANIIEKAKEFDDGTRHKTIKDRLDEIKEMKNEAFVIQSMMQVSNEDIEKALKDAEVALFEKMVAK